MDEEALFAAVLERKSEAERRAFLDEACAGNAPLRRWVERLLAAHERTIGILDQRDSPGGVPIDFDRPPGGETAPGGRPGPLIAGRYAPQEMIGEGGMGTVWLAEQTEPVRRRVAVKVARAGMGSKSVLARLEVERQALALMDHPNIAKVLDGGVTEDGRPYFVMEYVEGVTITQHCDDARLGIRERLALFVSVCQAVQHAHTKGIIHRDLKPSNVLVGLCDGVAVPKVIDFGVAKAIDERLAVAATLTQDGQLVGTPLYMSPEQAGCGDLDVDTRSDIYSLGVLLYELLTGSTPFEAKGPGKSSFFEILRAIREEVPETPSRRLATTEELTRIASHRRSEPARLGGLLRGDLDWIVMKALEKDRDRRYETAASLATDLKRYLSDEVVSARPPGTAYRLRKFVRRNQGRVAAATAMAVALVAGTAAVLAVQARADRERAKEAAARASRDGWTTASLAAAIREARSRADEAWVVTDYPDRMQRATGEALAATRRAEEFVGGGSPARETLAELAITRREIGDLDRHSRLIAAHDAGRQQFAAELTGQNAGMARSGLCRRIAGALREFGLAPGEIPAEEVARVVTDSRIRDALLGMLLEWHDHADYLAKYRAENPSKLPADPATDAAIVDRLARAIRATRHRCGGAYARWQDLADRDDAPGLVDLAGSPEALAFGPGLVSALGRDLRGRKQIDAWRAFLRAAVDRYPGDVWLHVDVAYSSMSQQPRDYPEALGHMSAASVLRPDSALFHYQVAEYYYGLGALDHAATALRKSISLYPESILARQLLVSILLEKKDAPGAIALLGEALRLSPDDLPMTLQLGVALAASGCLSEGRELMLSALQRDTPRAGSPPSLMLYNAGCFAMNLADGKLGGHLTTDQRSSFREEALAHLNDQLALFRDYLPTGPDFVNARMQHWLKDADLNSVREAAALENLAPDEQDSWNALWAEVHRLRDATTPRAEAP